MSLEAAILGFLRERPRSGYDLKTRCFDVAARALWTADQAQIYRTLERLQTGDLVSSTRKRQAGKPDRRVYAITDAGRSFLSAWLAIDQPLAPPREPFQLQLFFASSLGDEEILQLLTQRRARHQSRLDDLRAQAAEYAAARGSARQSALREVALDGAISAERSAIDWLDDTIETLRAGGLPAQSADGDETRTLAGSTPA